MVYKYCKYLNGIVTYILMTINSLQISCLVNLFCNGDFSSYKVPFYSSTTTYSLNYGIYGPDICWHFRNSPNMQVQKASFCPGKTLVELSVAFPYSLCQTVGLQINGTYNYSFNIYLNPYTNNSNVTVQINGVVVKICYKNYTSYPDATSCNGSFIPTVISNQLCVSSKQINFTPKIFIMDDFVTLVTDFVMNLVSLPNEPSNFTFNNINSNTFIDNTNYYNSIVNFTNNSIIYPIINNTELIGDNSTFEIAPVNQSISTNQVQYIIRFTIQPDQLNTIVRFKSKRFVSPIMKQYFLSYCVILLEGKPAEYKYVQNQDDQFIIELSVENSFCFQSIDYYFDYSSSGLLQFPKYKLQFQWLHSIAYFTSENEKKNLLTAQSVSKNVINVIFTSVKGMQNIFCSYLVINFISFFNIILLYNFLNLNLQPKFSYQTLKQLAQLVFDNSNTLVGTLRSISQRANVQININFQNFVSTSQQRQKVPEKDNNFYWFNSLGVTYNFFLNNLSQILTILLIFVKVLLLNIVARIFNKLANKKLFKLRGFNIIIIIQFICGSATINISILQTLTRSGFWNFNEKINTSLHCFVFLIIIFSLFFYYIFLDINNRNRIRHIQLKLKQQKSDDQQQVKFKLSFLKQKQKSIFSHSFSFLQYSLYILISCMIVLRNKLAFFIAITIFIIFISVCYVKGFKYETIYKRIYQTLILIVLITHHFCFFFMFIFSKLNIESQIKFSHHCKMSGIIVIWTVIVGSLIEVVGSCIEILIFIVKFFRKIVKKLREQKKVISVEYNKKDINQQQIISNIDMRTAKNKKIKSKISQNNENNSQILQKCQKQELNKDNKLNKGNESKIILIKNTKSIRFNQDTNILVNIIIQKSRKKNKRIKRMKNRININLITETNSQQTEQKDQKNEKNCSNAEKSKKNDRQNSKQIYMPVEIVQYFSDQISIKQQLEDLQNVKLVKKNSKKSNNKKTAQNNKLIILKG